MVVIIAVIIVIILMNLIIITIIISEPPTPTRAPDDQIRKMQYQANYVRNASLLKFMGLGSGVLTPSATLSQAATSARSERVRRAQ